MISVIIPSYNHAHYISEAIDSVLNQTISDIELIIIDDGSFDNTKEVLESYNDERMKITWQENQGAHNAINRGLQYAKGEYIAILNSDDFFELNYFEKCLEYFQDHPSVEFISSDINIVDEHSQNKGIKKSWYNMQPWNIPDMDNSLLRYNSYIKSLLVSNFISTTTNMFFSREVLSSVGLMRNLRFVHDWDFALRVARSHEVGHLSSPLVNYRVHSNNTISKNRNWMLFELLWIWATHFEYFSNTLLQDMRPSSIQRSFDEVMNSFNFQGNDKVALTLFWQIRHLRVLGYDSPEEIYLNESELRENILKHITE